MESTEYKNRITKKRSWEELVELFADPEDTIGKKKNLGKYQLFISILFHMNSITMGRSKHKMLLKLVPFLHPSS